MCCPPINQQAQAEQDRRIAVYVYGKFAEDRLSQMAECTPKAAEMAKPGIRYRWQHVLAAGIAWGMIVGVWWVCKA